MAKFNINDTVIVTSVTGAEFTGKVAGFKKVRNNSFKWEWLVKVEITVTASDGEMVVTEYHKPKALKRA